MTKNIFTIRKIKSKWEKTDINDFKVITIEGLSFFDAFEKVRQDYKSYEVIRVD